MSQRKKPTERCTPTGLVKPRILWVTPKTVNRGATEPYQLGNGYGHIAFVVDDLQAERARIVALGLEPGEIKELHREGRMLARYCFIADPDGYKIEILERHGRYR